MPPAERAAPAKPRTPLTNDRYVILLKMRSGTERYYRGKKKWVKVTLRGRRMPATAEQVLNHLLPALAGVKRGIAVEVEYRRPRPRGPKGSKARD